MKMHDLGERMNSMAETAPKAPKKYYPSLRLTAEQFPPLKGKQVGDLCRLEITARVTGMDQHNENPASYTLEIRKAARLHGKGNDAGKETY